jgi:hypothetical protein
LAGGGGKGCELEFSSMNPETSPSARKRQARCWRTGAVKPLAELEIRNPKAEIRSESETPKSE